MQADIPRRKMVLSYNVWVLYLLDKPSWIRLDRGVFMYVIISSLIKSCIGMKEASWVEYYLEKLVIWTGVSE
jgi:hypothetical protein